MRPALILPARDEAAAVGLVVARVPPSLGAVVIVVDNGSRDATAQVARAAGAEVVTEPRPGYGWACVAGSRRAAELGCDVAVFLDADGTMDPEEISVLLQPIELGRADVVCGVRQAGRGAMPWHQALANRVIGFGLRRRGVCVGELGPYRAVRMETLAELGLGGSRFAWPAEMLIRARKTGARIVAVPVGYAPRAGGRSKVGGSLSGSLRATWDIGRVLVGARR